MNVVFFEVEDWEADVLRHGALAQSTVVHEPLGPDNAAQHAAAEVVSCFIYSDLSAAVLQQLPNLKMIATRSTGFDHIDLSHCAARGITVCNVPAYGENTVAEHVFALLLALSRHIPQAVQRTREGSFSFTGLRGFDLCGKTIGLIGAGLIGQKVAAIAGGFGMRVLAHDVAPNPATGLDYAGLDELLRSSDIISLHVPGTPQTRHMISDAQFAMMKDGVILINTARGAIVDVKALLRALASGKVGGAGLDVLPDEPAIREEAELLRGSFPVKHDLEVLLADHALMHHKNVVVTPHSAFYTQEAVAKILQVTEENIRAFRSGTPVNVVRRA